MTRRELLTLACGWVASAADGDADVTLRIGEMTLEIAPKRAFKTLAYNGQVPGPLLRFPVGRPVTVDVWNDTKDADIVHWHGFHIGADVDGAIEEGTPPVPPGGRQRYSFTPNPAGTRWYHSHAMADHNLRKGTYTGQFGMVVVEGRADRSDYDREIPILLHEWEPRFTKDGPMDVEFRSFSINGKMLGAGEPIRVRPAERVLFRMVNASATLAHRLALPGHVFEVIALDGNPVATPERVPVIDVAPGERVDAIVVMNRPGVWVFGDLKPAWRGAGMGIVVEYAGRTGAPAWQLPPNIAWSYGAFGGRDAAPDPDARTTLVFKATGDGHHWTINGKSFPKTDPIEIRANRRHRLILDNQSADDHPVHLHRHTFEVVRFAGEPLSGIRKDVVVVPAWKQVEIDVVSDQPGLSLFHCHQQFHMDMGFMTLVRCV